MPNQPCNPGAPSNMNGNPSKKVSKLPRKTDAAGEAPFCLRSSTLNRAKVKPVNSASRLPTSPPGLICSKKNMTMPVSTAVIVNQSCSVTRSLRIQADSKATCTGAVYCSRIALAAVVNLLATTNSDTVSAYATAHNNWVADQVILRSLRNATPMTRAEIRLRTPEIAIPFQSTHLMNRPPVLQSKAANKRNTMARLWSGRALLASVSNRFMFTPEVDCGN